MTELLEEMTSDIMRNRVPRVLQDHAFESTKPLASWMRDLRKRVEFFSRWLDRCRSPDFIQSINLPRAVWLSAFFFPQGFLTAVLQAHARMRNLPIDSLAYEFQVTDACWTGAAQSQTDFQPNNIAFQQQTLGGSQLSGVRIFGLYLDGARWSSESQSLEESVRGLSIEPLPEVVFTPTVMDTSTIRTSSSQVYECPVYKTSQRAKGLSKSSNFVHSIRIPSNVQPDKWVLHGVATLCQPPG
jgi:dynein heavy chain